MRDERRLPGCRRPLRLRVSQGREYDSDRDDESSAGHVSSAERMNELRMGSTATPLPESRMKEPAQPVLL